jgi:hypothetical protein
LQSDDRSERKREDWWPAFRANLVPGLKAKISLFQEKSDDESNEKWYVGPNCYFSIGIIHRTKNEVCVMLPRGVFQEKSNQRWNGSTKTRMVYTAGNEADDRWVEAATTATSVRQEGYGYRQLQWQAILQ